MRRGSNSSPATRQFYSAAGARAVDAAAWRAQGDSDGFRLMCRAGRSALNHACSLWPDVPGLAVLCGPGNNGGDGYVLADLACARGIAVDVWASAAPRGGEALKARDAFAGRGGRIGSIDDFSANGIGAGTLIVDALLGTGLTRAPDAGLAAVIDAVNALPNPVFALDVPTGLDADTGATPGAVIDATATLSFIVTKLGLVTGRGPAVAGALSIDDLGIASDAFAAAQPVAYALEPDPTAVASLCRHADSNKGSHGHVLVIAGNASMGGAALLCARGALRAGAGLVSVATRREHVASAQTAIPEAMSRAVDNAADLAPLLARASVVAIGPGLGLDEWALRLFGAAADSGLPVVIDADALTLLARGASADGQGVRVLTPHPGEAGRLLGTDAERVNLDRLGAAQTIAEKFEATVLLKGAGTVVVEQAHPPHVLLIGNPGMATGGMGDVLTGIIAALIAQGLPASDATRLGAWLHAEAADSLVRQGHGAGFVASEVADELPTLRALLEAHANGL